MNDILSKRGPDADGKFIEKNYAIGHRRLSIRSIQNMQISQYLPTDIFFHLMERFLIIMNCAMN